MLDEGLESVHLDPRVDASRDDVVHDSRHRDVVDDRLEGVKVHNLMVLRKTELAKWWRDGKVDILDPNTYVDWLADFVERLLPEQVLHRITGDAPIEERLAPRWDLYKNEIRERLTAELGRRGTEQGSLVNEASACQPRFCPDINSARMASDRT